MWCRCNADGLHLLPYSELLWQPRISNWAKSRSAWTSQIRGTRLNASGPSASIVTSLPGTSSFWVPSPLSFSYSRLYFTSVSISTQKLNVSLSLEWRLDFFKKLVLIYSCDFCKIMINVWCAPPTTLYCAFVWRISGGTDMCSCVSRYVLSALMSACPSVHLSIRPSVMLSSK